MTGRNHIIASYVELVRVRGLLQWPPEVTRGSGSIWGRIKLVDDLLADRVDPACRDLIIGKGSLRQRVDDRCRPKVSRTQFVCRNGEHGRRGVLEPHPFEITEKESPVLEDRAARAGTEIVAQQEGLLAGNGVHRHKVILRVEGLVLVVPEERPVEAVRAAFRGCCNVPLLRELRVVVGGSYLDFADSLDGREEIPKRAVRAHGGRRNAVDGEFVLGDLVAGQRYIVSLIHLHPRHKGNHVYGAGVAAAKVQGQILELDVRLAAAYRGR